MSHRATQKTSPELEPSVSYSHREGLLHLQNADLFRPGHEPECARLIESLLEEHDVCSVHISLPAAICSIQFPVGTSDLYEISSRVAAALRSAFTKHPDREPGTMQPSSWITLAGYRFGQGFTLWATPFEKPGHIRLRNQTLASDALLTRQIAAGVAQLAGVESCRPTLWHRDLDIRYTPAVVSPAELSRSVAETFQTMITSANATATFSADPQSPPVATGLKRAQYIVLAAGSFVLTIVGVVLPIVPTVPFLMATSYYLVRASPALNRRLLRSQFFGPIIKDLQSWGGLRPINKLKLIGLALAFGVVTIVLIGPPAVVVLIMLAVYGATITFIARMPGVPEGLNPPNSQPELALSPA